MAETISIDEALGGMSKEEYAEMAGLLPSKGPLYPDFLDYYDSIDDYFGPDPKLVLAGRLNSLFGSPSDWPTGELSAFAEKLADYDENFDAVFSLAFVQQERGAGWICSLAPSRQYGSDIQAGGSSRIKEGLYVRAVSCPDMPRAAMKQLLGDPSLTEVMSHISPEQEEAVKRFVPLITSDSMHDLEAVIEHSAAAPKNALSRAIYDFRSRGTETISVVLNMFTEDYRSDYEGYYSAWKGAAEINMDPDRANVLLTALRNLKEHGIEITEAHPLPPAAILKLSEMVDDGLCDHREAIVPSIMFQPAERNRVFIASRYDYEYPDPESYGGAEESPMKSAESLEYLPDTDRFLISTTRYDPYAKRPEDSFLSRSDQIITKSYALQLITDFGFSTNVAINSPEVNKIIDRLKHEVAPDSASEHGCDLGVERDDARGASGAMDIPVEQEHRTDMGR